jgi:hypothetical protein
LAPQELPNEPPQASATLTHAAYMSLFGYTHTWPAGQDDFSAMQPAPPQHAGSGHTSWQLTPRKFEMAVGSPG